MERLRNEDNHLITELEQQYGKVLTFRPDSILHQEDFKIIDPSTGQEF
jgi:ribonuclease G